MPSFLSSLRHPLSTPTRRLVLANFLLVVCFTATYFVGLIGCATYQLGAGAFEVSALVVLVNVTLVVGGALAGVVTDRIGPRRTLVASLAGFALIGVFALLMPLNYPMLAVASALEGLADGFCGTTVSAYPRFLTNRPRELKRLNSLCGTSVSVAVIVGPLVGGAVTALSTNQVCFATIPVALLLAAVLVWATPEALDAMGEQHRDNQQGEKAAASGGFWHQLAEGFRVTFSHGTLRTLFLIYFLGFFAYGAFDSLESLFYRDVLRVGGDWMGWLSACAGVGATAGSLLVVRVPTKRLTLGTLSALLLVTGLGSMIYVGTANVGVAILGQLVTGLGFGAMRPVKDTILQRSCDISYVGRVTAVMNAGTNSAGTLPLLVAPLVANVLGVQGTLFAASAIVAALALAFLLIAHNGEKNAARETVAGSLSSNDC
ncbi:MFS transporter [Tractidigestivibacter montrealensis]|uniref:MFS transporter n=1 Tax=Tractidigestivibacter montrealensis TaxID=2972466 RepID=A0ABT1ZA14_9ACTN|nr:MFS transporter [Tractidigestivibacter montrealensis]MCR9037060.1 MFS transporter [Tractidigestivibacter montrealensis]